MKLSYNELVQLEETIKRGLSYTIEDFNKIMAEDEDIDFAELEASASDIQGITTLLRKMQQAIKAYETEEQTEDATEQ